MASRRTRVGRVERALAREQPLIVTRTGTMAEASYAESARIAVDAAGCPDLMGAKEVAIELGTSVTNLRAVTRLPDPVAEVAATRLWDADEIRRFARERKRKAIGAGGIAPHLERQKQKRRVKANV